MRKVIMLLFSITTSKKIFCLIFPLCILLASCSGGKRNKLLDYNQPLVNNEGTPVNAIEQAMPTIMIIPSDNLLKQYGALSEENIDGKNVLLRDYSKFLISNNNNKAMMSIIQNEFVELDFPLTDLEQSLKSIQNQQFKDEADGLERDPKTMLLTTIAPDIILELDYNYGFDTKSSDVTQRRLSYTLNAIDAYTNKMFSSHTYDNIIGTSLNDIFENSIEDNIESLSDEIQNYFADIIYRGREITVRIAVEKGCKLKLSHESVEGCTYADWIIDYIKVNTKKGAYKLQNNTDNELSFLNVRIKTLNDDGTQFGVYDWSRDLCDAMKDKLGVKCTNKSQGLGEVLITIKGM